MMKLLLFITLFLGLQSSYANPRDRGPHIRIDWPENKSTVAWQAERTLFLFKEQTTHRINSEIKIRLDQQDDKKALQLYIPIDQFNYDELFEEFFLSRILLKKERPVLEIQTAAVDEKTWKHLLAGQIHRINGYLTFGKKHFPLNFNIQIARQAEHPFIDVMTSTSFSHLEIDPPSLLFGLIVKAEDKLSLAARIYLKDIDGFNEKLIIEKPRELNNGKKGSARKRK